LLLLPISKGLKPQPQKEDRNSFVPWRLQRTQTGLKASFLSKEHAQPKMLHYYCLPSKGKEARATMQ